MSQELIYTSAPKGLRAASSGFCTVAYTRGMPGNWVGMLEGLSGYKPVFPAHDSRAQQNPVSFSHYTFTMGTQNFNILSRISFAGFDYSGRSNKLGHHIVVDPSEFHDCGPAAVMLQKNTFVQKWEKAPEFVEGEKKLVGQVFVPSPAIQWKNCTGNAGWAGVLAYSFLKNPEKVSFIVFDPEGHKTREKFVILNLIEEAIKIIPKSHRWKVSFNTYFQTLPGGAKCVWRCCLKNSPVLVDSRRITDTLVIDLTNESEVDLRQKFPESAPFIEAAEKGCAVPDEEIYKLIIKKKTTEDIKIIPFVANKKTPQIEVDPKKETGMKMKVDDGRAHIADLQISDADVDKKQNRVMATVVAVMAIGALFLLYKLLFWGAQAPEKSTENVAKTVIEGEKTETVQSPEQPKVVEPIEEKVVTKLKEPVKVNPDTVAKVIVPKIINGDIIVANPRFWYDFQTSSSHEKSVINLKGVDQSSTIKIKLKRGISSIMIDNESNSVGTCLLYKLDSIGDRGRAAVRFDLKKDTLILTKIGNSNLVVNKLISALIIDGKELPVVYTATAPISSAVGTVNKDAGWSWNFVYSPETAEDLAVNLSDLSAYSYQLIHKKKLLLKGKFDKKKNQIVCKLDLVKIPEFDRILGNKLASLKKKRKLALAEFDSIIVELSDPQKAVIENIQNEIKIQIFKRSKPNAGNLVKEVSF